MKKNNTLAMIALIVAVIALVVAIINKDSSKETTTVVTTQETWEEITTEVSETEVATEVSAEEEAEANDDFKEIEISASELPFHFGYSKAVGEVKLYVPNDPNGIAYIEVEHADEYPVILKLDQKEGIIVDNIIAQKEMFNANWTFLYFDGIYSENYTIDRDGSMLIFKDFPDEVEEISIKNREPMPIFIGEIAGESVNIHKIIIK